MSRSEYAAYCLGELLTNETDHYQGGRGGSVSKGFCFFAGAVDEWAHRLNGLVTFDVLLTAEVVWDELEADVRISSGVYADNPSAKFPHRKLYREFCTTRYSKESMRFISADFSYGRNPSFISKDECQDILNRLSQIENISPVNNPIYDHATFHNRPEATVG